MNRGRVKEDRDQDMEEQATPLARQLLLDSNDEDVELGSVYEIYHKNLPPRTPVQLRSTRIVMVSEKTDLNVAIRYPSILSLHTYFSNGITEMYPALDEKFVMGIKLAGKVLLRQVPSQEFAEKKHLKTFWLTNPNSEGNLVINHEDIGLAKELKNNEMIRWGVRRQVMFVGRRKDTSKTQSSSSFVEGEKVKDQQEIKDDEYGDKEEKDDEAEPEPEPEEETLTHTDDHKRKLKSGRILRKRKRAKQVKQSWQVDKKPMKKCKKLALRDPNDRWSKERYMAAEQSLLEAMMEKQAMIGNPITRPELRLEARKRIGDTGLLDHLLKHVANKVAPGGALRFRRSHNADGAMEYWLESADLLKIRKDAGVTDPFWTPPPGWKPGDSPIQDPIMAKELTHLKQEISNIKRDIEELISKNKQDQSQTINVVSERVDSSPKQLQVVDICNFLLPSDSDTDNSILSREKCKKQMLIISDLLKKIEAWMQVAEVGKETREMEARTEGKAGTELISGDELKEEGPGPGPGPADKKEAGERETCEGKLVGAAPAGEGKAAKIERLKSGFRLCRPEGTFLWPNMSTSCSSSSSQVEDLLVVPTPPSVNSSSALTHHHLHHHLNLASPPVKPVPERRLLTSTSTSTLINLNDVPTSQLQQHTTTTVTLPPCGGN